MALVKKNTPPDRDIQRLFQMWANLESLLKQVVGRKIFKYPMADIISLAGTVEKANSAYWDLVYKKYPHLISTALTGKANGAIYYEEEEPEVVDASKPIPNPEYRICEKCGNAHEAREEAVKCCEQKPVKDPSVKF